MPGGVWRVRDHSAADVWHGEWDCDCKEDCVLSVLVRLSYPGIFAQKILVYVLTLVDG